MSPEERQLLNELFARVGQAASTPRDAEAEAMIRDELARHPYAAYYLAQAVILQEKGLEASAARIGQLEEQVKDLQQQGATAQQNQPGQSGGFLSGLSSLFGGNAQGQSAPPPQAPSGPWGRSGPEAPAYDGGYTRGAPPSGPWSQPSQPAYAPQPSRGGGFLSGAMTTAAGVAGGMLMADAVRGLFAPHFGSGGLFGGGGVTGAPVVEENVVNNFFDNGNQQGQVPDQSNNWQNGDVEQSALADMSNATQNTDGVDNADYDDSSFDSGGFDDDSNFA